MKGSQLLWLSKIGEFDVEHYEFWDTSAFVINSSYNYGNNSKPSVAMGI